MFQNVIILLKFLPSMLNLIFTTPLANSADDKLVIVFFVFPRKQDLTFQFSYACMKNGTYYVTGYGVRPSVNLLVSG